MSNSLSSMFDELGRIVTVCPDCEELFYLAEARPYRAGTRSKSVVDRLRAEIRKLERAEERLAEIETELRRRSQVSGRKKAKAMLKKIDPVFSGSGLDPQDVKVIFHPVSYIVFDGLAEENLRRVRLLAHSAKDSSTERLHKSIDQAVMKGNYEFKVLRVDGAGLVTAE